MCLISVIIPTFNSAPVLRNAIESYLNQRFESVELLIIDGGSIDGTIDILTEYNDSIAYWVSEPDRGLYDAMNKGIEKAHGKWLYFLGSDDQIREDVFNFVQPYLQQNHEIVYGNVVYDNGHIMYSKFNLRMILENTLHHQSAFYHRSLFSTFRYDTSLKVVADYELNLRAYLSKANTLKLSKTIATCGSVGVSMVLSSNEINIVRSRYINSPIIKNCLNYILDLYYAYFKIKKAILASRVFLQKAKMLPLIQNNEHRV
jgi:putative colanic acid biosynthesis glycosyltransferase